MNFLLYLLGRAQRTSLTRPGPRQLLLTQAATHLAHGNLDIALHCYRQLGRTSKSGERLGITTIDLLIRAHLFLVSNNLPAAHHNFSRGIDRLLSRRPKDAPADASETVSPATAVEALFSQADTALRRGRYVRAATILEETRSLLDLLLSAHAGLLLVEQKKTPDAGELDLLVLRWLLPLVKLSDISLRLLARAHLATHLSHSLRKRQLRDDLAPWAVTSPCIDSLLDGEFARLSQAAQDNPAHAENHYRLALVARATNHSSESAAAFTQTLHLHPHHVPSAARLLATQRQLNTPLNLAPLSNAFHIPQETLSAFAAFADAASDNALFDRTADHLCLHAPSDTLAAATRANLAFALAELALLDPSHVDWRNPATATHH